MILLQQKVYKKTLKSSIADKMMIAIIYSKSILHSDVFHKYFKFTSR